MTKPIKKSDSELVNEHIAKLEPELGKTVAFIRKTILDTNKQIGERIKWNNPSFYYTGPMKESDPKEYKREIAVFNLFKGRIMLVLPSGAKLNNTGALLEGDYADGRRLIIFKDLPDAKAKAKNLQGLMNEWLDKVEK